MSYPIQLARSRLPRCATRRWRATGCSIGSRQDPPARRPRARRRRLRQDHAPRRLLATDAAADHLVSARRGRPRLGRFPEPTWSRPAASTTRVRAATAAILEPLGAGRPDPRGRDRDLPRASCRRSPRGRRPDPRRLPSRRRVADIRLIVREIVARAPERLSIVFASRRLPPVPVAGCGRLGRGRRARDRDLRFSDARDRAAVPRDVRRPLEPDVLAELAARTEGWAASLQLVQAALRDRSPAETRSFVRGLTGARPRALRLPRRRGRRRPARRPAAVPDADVDAAAW